MIVTIENWESATIMRRVAAIEGGFFIGLVSGMVGLYLGYHIPTARNIVHFT